MWRTWSLRSRIYLLLAALVAVAISSGLVMVGYTYRMQALMRDIISRNLASLEAATALETALALQKGFASYYFMDRDPEWLQQFERHRRIFQERLQSARQLAQNPAQQAAVKVVADEYDRYIAIKERVIAHYQQGEMDQGARVHREVRQLFADILGHCGAYKRMHLEQIRSVQSASESTAARLRLATAATILVQMVLAIGLGVFLIHQILIPVYRILKNTERDPAPGAPQNAVVALSRNVNHLLKTVDQARSALEKSRENLLQAEKMALVGKLAAGMAHSIRNPFTSVKMRLFSLGRSLELDATQQEDFDVISQEIRHIDNIVQNFLEFSRPPKLVMQPISPSAIVDNALQLLSHRLEAYGVKIELVRSGPLPEVMADPEQLKEVLVNLIVNACEEMTSGGSVIVGEQVEATGERREAVVYVSDTGPGVPPGHADKIFQPFFTCKEEGTGLGLSIASRIVKEHGGTLSLDSDQAAGATFVIRLPIKESDR